MTQKLHIGVQAHDMGLRQCHVQPRQGFFTRGPVHDQLGDHGVVIRRNGVARAHA